MIARTGATLTYVPVLLGGIFKATGNASPAMVPAKGRWMGTDMARFAKRHGIEFRSNPYFPINTMHLMRGATGLIEDIRFDAYVNAVFDAMWREPKNLGEPAELIPVLEQAGLTADEFRTLTERDDVKDRLRARQRRLLFRQLIRFHRRKNAVILRERVCARGINLSRYFRRIPRTLRKKLVKMVCAPNVKHSAAGITILMVRE